MKGFEAALPQFEALGAQVVGISTDHHLALAALQKEQAAAMAHRDLFGWSQDRPCALREPNLDGFTGQEIAIVDQVLRALWGKSAKDVSDLSHQFIGWRIADMGEVIPYETATIDNSEPTEDEEEYARELAATGL